jgi:hypothetical protein
MEKIKKPPAEKTARETAALVALMHMHREAAAFYRIAVGKTGSAVADEAFLSLLGIHEKITDDLWSYARVSNAADFLEDADYDVRDNFRPLVPLLPHGPTPQLAEGLAAATESCMHGMEEAMDGAATSLKFKNFLKSQCDILEAARDPLRVLRDAAR